MNYKYLVKSYFKWYQQVVGDELFLDEKLPQTALQKGVSPPASKPVAIDFNGKKISLHQEYCKIAQQSPFENRETTTSPASLPKRPGPANKLPSIQSLESLYDYLNTSGLYERNGNKFDIILPNGPPNCRLAIVSMVPDMEDGKQGTVFQGQNGRLLDKMLAAIDIRRDEVYCTSIVKNFDLNPMLSWREKGQFVSLTYRELSFIASHIILLLGENCCQSFLKSGKGLQSFRKIQHTLDKIDILKGKIAVSTFHPGFLNKYEKFKPQAWEDLQWIKTVI